MATMNGLWLAALCACTRLEGFTTDGSRPAEAAPTPPTAAAQMPILESSRTSALAPHPGRVVAIGDLHGDLGQTVAALALAGLIDSEGHWAGGTTIFVQTGDVVDRGGDSRAVFDLLRRLEAEAPKHGGRVVALIGNHERMNTAGDWRYVPADDIADFGDRSSREAAFRADGEYGAWIATHDAVALVGDTVFVHGGLRERWAENGLLRLNDTIRHDLFRNPPSGASGDDGPMWFRGYAQAPEDEVCPELERSLSRLGARRMVVGHTVQAEGRIASRCDGRLHAIDVGLSKAYGSHLAVWESKAGDARALYMNGAQDLPEPTAQR